MDPNELDPIPPDPQELYPGQSQEIAAPNDFWSRIASASGPQPFDFQVRRSPNALEIILGLAAATGNAKAARAASGLVDVQEKNKRIREAAAEMAKHRHELRRIRAQGAETRANREAGVTTSEEAAEKAGAVTGAQLDAYTERGLPPPRSPRPATTRKGPSPKGPSKRAFSMLAPEERSSYTAAYDNEKAPIAKKIILARIQDMKDGAFNDPPNVIKRRIAAFAAENGLAKDADVNNALLGVK